MPTGAIFKRGASIANGSFSIQGNKGLAGRFLKIVFMLQGLLSVKVDGVDGLAAGMGQSQMRGKCSNIFGRFVRVEVPAELLY